MAFGSAGEFLEAREWVVQVTGYHLHDNVESLVIGLSLDFLLPTSRR